MREAPVTPRLRQAQAERGVSIRVVVSRDTGTSVYFTCRVRIALSPGRDFRVLGGEGSECYRPARVPHRRQRVAPDMAGVASQQVDRTRR